MEVICVFCFLFSSVDFSPGCAFLNAQHVADERARQRSSTIVLTIVLISESYNVCINVLASHIIAEYRSTG